MRAKLGYLDVCSTLLNISVGYTHRRAMSVSKRSKLRPTPEPSFKMVLCSVSNSARPVFGAANGSCFPSSQILETSVDSPRRSHKKSTSVAVGMQSQPRSKFDPLLIEEERPAHAAQPQGWVEP